MDRVVHIMGFLVSILNWKIDFDSQKYSIYNMYRVTSTFLGRDASRSFITGLFDEDNLTDDVIDMNPNDLIGLDTWINTYRKKYKEIGNCTFYL